MRKNEFDQVIGEALPDFQLGEFTKVATLNGKTVRLERLSIDHAKDLYETTYGPTTPASHWTYYPLEGFTDFASFEDFFSQQVASTNPYHMAIVD